MDKLIAMKLSGSEKKVEDYIQETLTDQQSDGATHREIRCGSRMARQLNGASSEMLQNPLADRR
jgi:hypothetical protein